MGNEFLSNIAAVDAMYHVCRVFDSEEVSHVEGNVDPIRDLEIIHTELRAKDLQQLRKRIEPLVRQSKGDKAKKLELDCMEKLVALLESGKDARFGEWNIKEVEMINPLNLLTAKPIIYLLNMSEVDYIKQRSKWLPKIKEYVQRGSSSDSPNPNSLTPFAPTFHRTIMLTFHLSTILTFFLFSIYLLLNCFNVTIGPSFETNRFSSIFKGGLRLVTPRTPSSPSLPSSRTSFSI